MREKDQEERYAASLIMLTAKATEGCTPCLDGYKRMALAAGVPQKEMDFAIATGQRVHRNMLAGVRNNQAPQNVEGAESEPQYELIVGDEAGAFFQQVLEDEKVQQLDAYFRAQGYQPVEDARGLARLQFADRICTEAYVPYQLDETHFSWIDYHQGRSGVDLVGVTVDLAKKDMLADGRLPYESVIVQGNQVVAGHACDMGSFWYCLATCCGPSAVTLCLFAGPGWWTCAFGICGGCAVYCCFNVGCC
jgi:hypothetical protein